MECWPTCRSTEHQQALVSRTDRHIPKRKGVGIFSDWDHSVNEWIDTESRRLRVATEPNDDQIEDKNKDGEDMSPRSIALKLWKEYKAYQESKKQSKVKKRLEKQSTLKSQQIPKEPIDMVARIQEIANVTSQHQRLISANNGSDPFVDVESLDIVMDVDPINIETTDYKRLPQLLRIKDYTRFYSIGMKIAAKDRNKEWWNATIRDIRSFRVLCSL